MAAVRVGVIQSNYIPWRGYFDFIRSVDLFVFHDDIQYTKQDWRNRNKIRTPSGTEWLTVPVKKAPVETTIDDTQVCAGWEAEHLRKLERHLGKAPHFKDVLRLLDLPELKSLAELNRALIFRICTYLQIYTETVRSADLHLSGTKTDRLIDIMQKVGGKTYVSGPAAKSYLEVEKMNQAGFDVEWKTYGPYPDYQQQYEGFEPAVTVLDLIANVGPEARKYL